MAQQLHQALSARAGGRAAGTRFAMALSVAGRAAVALELGAAVLLMWPLVWAEQEVPVQIGQRVSDGLPDASSGLVA